jgi:hypothetical protein
VYRLGTRGTDDLHKKVILAIDKKGVLANSDVAESNGETKLGIAE